MIGPDFEYRLYTGAVLPVDLYFAQTILSGLLADLRIVSGKSIRAQLEDHFADQNIPVGGFDLSGTLGDFLEKIDPDLMLDPLDLFLGEVRWPPVGLLYARFRFYIQSDWELRLPKEKTITNWPDHATLLDDESDQLRVLVNIEQISLLNGGVRVEIYNPFKEEWSKLLTIPLLTGTGLYKIQSRLALGLSVANDSYEIGAGSEQRFRPVTITFQERDSTIDKAEFKFGQVEEWVILALGLVFGLVGTLTAAFLDKLKVALGEKVLEKIEEQIEKKLTAISVPKILDFPFEAKYGPAFQRPSAEHVTFEYRPGIDIAGDEQNRRAVHFRHIEPDERPGFDPRALFDPKSFDNPFDRIRDYVNVGDLVVDLFDIHVPIPDITTDFIPRKEIDGVVRQFADTRFRFRDRALLHLLKDGLSARLLSQLSWSQVDLEGRVIVTQFNDRRQSLKIGSESVTALRAWYRQQPGYFVLLTFQDRTNLVFPTPQALPMGTRGIVAVLLAYKRWRDLIDGWQDPWSRQYSSTPPLPVTLETILAFGYAVNFVVPNVQFTFLHAARGFDLQSEDFSMADYGSLYPFPTDQAFTLRTANPPSPPSVDFYDASEKPQLQFSDLPLELRVSSPDELPLRATANLKSQLAIRFCPACITGTEDQLKELLGNLLCLQEIGLIDLQGNIAKILQCLIHRHAIALTPNEGEGAVKVESVTVNDLGTFPPGSPGELAALLNATLPSVLSAAIPVPVLFDLFYRVPVGSRNRTEETLEAKDGWMMLVQPLVQL